MELAIEPPVWNPGAPYQGKVVVLRPFWLIAVIFIRSRVLSGLGRGVFRFGQQTLALRTSHFELRVVGCHLDSVAYDGQKYGFFRMSPSDSASSVIEITSC
ncbi:MAG TPA: hypothetical protein VMY18_00555 [Acidobacteriota bacterium]|nr:hypothetical protein [Acidobacteriota bacterium]